MEKQYEIFLSHSSKDRGLVQALMRFFQLGLDIPKKSIYSTSEDGTLPYGEPFSPKIREGLQNSKNTVLLITSNYFSSPFCMAELGAAWALGVDITPILIPPMNAADFNRTPIGAAQFLMLKGEEGLLSLADHFSSLGLAQSKTSSVTRAVKDIWPALSACTNDNPARLMKQADGYYQSVIREPRTLPHPYNETHCCYKIDGFLEEIEKTIANETHWLFYRKDRFGIDELEIGQQVRFKVQRTDLRNFHDLPNARNIYLDDLQLVK